MLAQALYLIPVPIAPLEQEDALSTLPSTNLEMVKKLSHFAVENLKTARAFLKLVKHPIPLRELSIVEIQDPLAQEWIQKKIPVGVLSEAGCPGIADPGAKLVEYAHQHQYPVLPLIGPSSILLSLMASGLNGQKFSFEGYLPIPSHEKKVALLRLEKLSKEQQQTIIFIETPYRNESMFESLLQTLNPKTKLCIALHLTTPQQKIKMQSIASWIHEQKTQPLLLPKEPCVFLFLA